MHRIRDLWSNERGNTAVLFGLAIIPVLALSGGAIDLAHRANVRSQVQAAADTAALAAARKLQSGQMEGEKEEGRLERAAEASAMFMFSAAVAQMGDGIDAEPDVVIDDQAIKITADVAVRTSFLNLIGINSLNADAFAEVNVPDPIKVEIALVLDYSKSMLDKDKYIRMTSAARRFIDKVGEERSGRTKIAIAPFSDYVYASLPGAFIRDTQPAEANQQFTTCLFNRDYPYSASEDAPYPALPASQWPRTAADDPQCKLYADGNLQLRDLTTDFNGLSQALSAMRPVGKTNIALATEMGWHILSPGAPFETAAPYSDVNVRKIMILLTDGVQTMSAMGPSGEVSTLAADDTTAETCTNAKKAGVKIFTIAYDIEEPRVHDLLANCATGTSSFHEAGGTDISSVFDDIFQQISESVWLSK